MSSQKNQYWIHNADTVGVDEAFLRVSKAEDDPLMVMAPTNNGNWKKVPIVDTKKTPPVTNAWPCNPDNVEGCPDNTSLTYLHAPGMLNNMRVRFAKKEIYTYTGYILLALNPYEVLDSMKDDPPGDKKNNIYKTMEQYRNKAIGIEPPHSFAVADTAFRNLKSAIAQKLEKTDQSIMVSGESGAGKTESAKHVMKYLLHVGSRSGSDTSNKMVGVENRIVATNPILESFGNAKTTRNDNSSRFGKFIRLYFTREKNPIVIGAMIDTYLLEKARIVQQQEANRNFHIFYMMCVACNDADRKEWALKLPDEYYYINQGGWMTSKADPKSKDKPPFDPKFYEIKDEKGSTVDGKGRKYRDEHHEYKECRDAMTDVGISHADQQDCFRTLAGLLHLGNVSLEESKNGVAQISKDAKSTQALKEASRLLRIPEQRLTDTLLQRSILDVATKKQLLANNNAKQASIFRDGLVKFIYHGIFVWIVLKINESLAVTNEDGTKNTQGFTGANKPPAISILDIFGFEYFANNGFEQFCINYCNEKLQQVFNVQVFEAEKSIYKNEGIKIPTITNQDNQQTIDLIEKSGGIIAILDDQCRSANTTGQTFAIAIQTRLKNRFIDEIPKNQEDREKDANGLKYLLAYPSFSKSKGQGTGVGQTTLTKNEAFAVIHYAATVTYSTEAFISANNDSISQDLQKVVFESSSEYVKAVCTAENERMNKNSKSGASKTFFSVATQFSEQLKALEISIKATDGHFIRCIKPNATKAPFEFKSVLVYDQLHCNGMFDLLKLMQAGYPGRLKYKVIYDRFAPIIMSKPAVPDKHAYERKPNAAPMVGSGRPSDIKMLSEKLFSEALIMTLGKCDRSDFELGLTMVLFKAGKLAVVEDLRSDEGRDSIPADIANRIRHYVARKRWRQAIGTIKTFASLSSRLEQIRGFRKIQEAARLMMLLAPTWVRLSKSVRMVRAATKIKATFRMYQARKKFLKTRNAVILAQSLWRMLRVFRKYKTKLAQLREKRQKVALAEKQELMRKAEEARLALERQKEAERKKKEDEDNRRRKEEEDRLKRELEERLAREEAERQRLAEEARLEKLRKEEEERREKARLAEEKRLREEELERQAMLLRIEQENIAQKKIDKYKTEVVEPQIAELEEKAANAQKAAGEAKREIEKLKKQIKEAEAEIESGKEALSNKDADAQKQDDLIAKLRARIAELEKQVADLNAQLTDARNTINDLQLQVQRMEEANKNSKKSSSELATELARVRAEQDEIKQQFDLLKSQSKNREEMYQNKIRDLEESKASVDSELEEKENIVAKLAKEKADAEKKLSNAQAQLVEESSRAVDIKQQSSSRVQELEAQLQKVSHEKASMESGIKIQMAKAADAESRIQEIEDRIGGGDINKFIQDKAAAAAKLNAANMQINELNNELETIRIRGGGGGGASQVELDKKKKEVNALKLEMEQMKIDIQNLEEEKASALTRAAEATKTLDKVNTEHVEARMALVKEVAALESKVLQMEEAENLTQQQMERLKSKHVSDMQQLKADNSNAAIEAQQLQQQLDTQNARVKKLLEELRRSGGDSRNVDDSDALELEKDIFKIKFEDASKKLEERTDALVQLQRVHNELVQQSGKDSEQFHHATERLNAQVTALESNLATKDADYYALKCEYQELLNQKAQDYELWMQEKMGIAGKVDTLQSTLNDRDAQLAEGERSVIFDSSKGETNAQFAETKAKLTLRIRLLQSNLQDTQARLISILAGLKNNSGEDGKALKNGMEQQIELVIKSISTYEEYFKDVTMQEHADKFIEKITDENRALTEELIELKNEANAFTERENHARAVAYAREMAERAEKEQTLARILEIVDDLSKLCDDFESNSESKQRAENLKNLANNLIKVIKVDPSPPEPPKPIVFITPMQQLFRSTSELPVLHMSPSYARIAHFQTYNPATQYIPRSGLPILFSAQKTALMSQYYAGPIRSSQPMQVSASINPPSVKYRVISSQVQNSNPTVSAPRAVGAVPLAYVTSSGQQPQQQQPENKVDYLF